eukprot:g5629.t1
MQTEPLPNTAFVNNLSWGTTDEGLASHFTNNGFNVTQAVVQRHADSDRSKGWGLVSFSTESEMLNAINQMSGTELDGRQVMCREDRGKSDPPKRERKQKRQSKKRVVYDSNNVVPTNKVYVGNLNWETTTEELCEFLAQYNFVNAEVVYGRKGRSRGYGIVEFQDVETANRAIEALNNTELQDRTLYLRYDMGEPQQQ